MTRRSTHHWVTDRPTTYVELSSEILLDHWIGRCVRILDGRVAVACDRSKAFGVLIGARDKTVRVQIGGFAWIDMHETEAPVHTGTLMAAGRNGTIRPASVGDYVFGVAAGGHEEDKVQVKMGAAALSTDMWEISRESIRAELLQFAEEGQLLDEFEKAVDVVWRIRNGRE